MKQNEEFMIDVWIWDEAIFLLNGHINSKNWVFGGKRDSLQDH